MESSIRQGISALQDAHRLSVAPMMDWTDRHCRAFHRLMSASALLYTEMVTAQAVIHGDRARLIGYDPVAEGRVALQLGGSDPAMLAQATRIAVDFGYDVVNLNVGCPSDRVQSGCFGAVLMERPALVAECVAAMIDAAQGVPVTVKCRLGVDDQPVAETLPRFLESVSAAGVRDFVIHARKAWLQGLSPKENREIPPLDHGLALEMVGAFPALRISINGGITTLTEAEGWLDRGFAGVMVGRAAYHDPAAVLIGADARVWGIAAPGRDVFTVAADMRGYIARHLAAGGRLHQVTRHMLGLFTGRPGARVWRRILSEGAGGGLEVYDAALAAIVAQTERVAV